MMSPFTANAVKISPSKADGVVAESPWSARPEAANEEELPTEQEEKSQEERLADLEQQMNAMWHHHSNVIENMQCMINAQGQRIRRLELAVSASPRARLLQCQLSANSRGAAISRTTASTSRRRVRRRSSTVAHSDPYESFTAETIAEPPIEAPSVCSTKGPDNFQRGLSGTAAPDNNVNNLMIVTAASAAEPLENTEERSAIPAELTVEPRTTVSTPTVPGMNCGDIRIPKYTALLPPPPKRGWSQSLMRNTRMSSLSKAKSWRPKQPAIKTNVARSKEPFAEVNVAKSSLALPGPHWALTSEVLGHGLRRPPPLSLSVRGPHPPPGPPPGRVDWKAVLDKVMKPVKGNDGK